MSSSAHVKGAERHSFKTLDMKTQGIDQWQSRNSIIYAIYQCAWSSGWY